MGLFLFPHIRTYVRPFARAEPHLWSRCYKGVFCPGECMPFPLYILQHPVYTIDAPFRWAAGSRTRASRIQIARALEHLFPYLSNIRLASNRTFVFRRTRQIFSLVKFLSASRSCVCQILYKGAAKELHLNELRKELRISCERSCKRAAKI